jgi:pantoate ligase / CMP/dCMP kinase
MTELFSNSFPKTALFTKNSELRQFLRNRQSLGAGSIGLIPTMGALHQGHLSLIERSRQLDQTVVVSIFVNPLQFAPGEDYQQYPRLLVQDLALCNAAGVDAVFAPDRSEIWPENSIKTAELKTDEIRPLEPRTLVYPPAALTNVLCGRSRPGHFVGVATVVVKLLNIVQPQRAYFGQKDAQQLVIIQRIVNDLNLPVDIIQYLSAAQKQIAPQIYASLMIAFNAFIKGEKNSDRLCNLVNNRLTNLGLSADRLRLDYLEIVDQQTLQPIDHIQDSALLAIAVYLDKTRLIDNILLTNNS